MGMSDLPTTYIRHRGFFIFNAVTKAIQDWFPDQDYQYNVGDFRQKPGVTGTDYIFKAAGEKKVTEYVKFHIEIWARAWNMKDVEIIQDGKKIKTQEGQLQVEIMPKLELDWQKRFAGSKFLQKLGTFLETKVLKYKIGDYWEDMAIADGLKLGKTLRDVLGQEL